MTEGIETLSLDLEIKGYDGLYCPEGQCACELGDLCPCGEDPVDCKPGYKRTYDQLSDEMKKHSDPDCDWFIVGEK